MGRPAGSKNKPREKAPTAPSRDDVEINPRTNVGKLWICISGIRETVSVRERTNALYSQISDILIDTTHEDYEYDLLRACQKTNETLLAYDQFSAEDDYKTISVLLEKVMPIVGRKL